MAKGRTQVVKKNHSHPWGLKCGSCQGEIPYDEKYLEITLPSEVKKSICMICYEHGQVVA